MADSLILNWARNGVVAVAATASGQTIRLNQAAELVWPENAAPKQNPQAAGEALKTFLRQAGITGDSARICLPRDQVIVRHLDVPRVPEEELAEIVQMQAATKSSQPVDQLLIDFLPQPDQPGRELGSVLAATLNQSVAQTIEKTLKVAGIELEGIGLSSLGLAEFASASTQVAPQELVVAAELIGSRLEVALIRQQTIQLMQTSSLADVSSESVASEFRRILFAAQQTLGDVTVGQTVFFVGADEFQQFAGLSSLIEGQLTLLTPEDAPPLKIAASLPSDLNTSRLIAPLGLLLNQYPGVDFFHPREKRVVQDDSRRKMAIYAAGILTILSLGYYRFYVYVRDLDRQISQLQLDESNLKSGLANGQMVLDTDAQLKEWLDRDVHTLQELDLTQQTLPGTGSVYLSEYQFDVALGKNLAKVHAEGQAVERDVVEEVYREFDSAGFNVTPAAIRSGRRDSEYPVEFELSLERPVATETTTNTPRS
ncbi:MAG: hypothetical protein HUJ26_10700 [Planctomycetaceae bacterium]|nr:hypothetical protein [Planctomycetaceae bacterium]